MRQRKHSTLVDYRNVVRCYLLPGFGLLTPVEAITTDQIDAYREPLLSEGRLSPRTIQKILVLLHGGRFACTTEIRLIASWSRRRSSRGCRS